MADRGELRGQAARGHLGHRERVDRLLVGEPLGEREPGLDPPDEHLGCDAVPLRDPLLGHRSAGSAGGVETLEPDGAALLGVPVVVHLADDQRAALLQTELRPEPPLEAAVRGDVELAVVEGGDGAGSPVGRVGPVHHLEGQVGGGAACAGEQVGAFGREERVEVDGVGVVEPLACVLVRRVDEHRVLEVVVERHLQRAADGPGEVVVALCHQLGSVLLAHLERRVRDQLLCLRDRVPEGPGHIGHVFTLAMTDSANFSRCSIFLSSGSVSGPLM